MTRSELRATARAQVHVLSLGGTIAMTRQPAGGVVPTLSAGDLLGAVPGLAEVADVSALTFRRTPGAHLQLVDVVALAREIRGLAGAGAHGVVVTQGTDTIEETAYALDLLLDVDVAVVITGAMRSPEAPGADGPANLDAAVRVAADPAARGCGVLVVLNEEIHAARWVTKTHTSRPDAFRSPECGACGAVTEGRVLWFWRPGRSVVIDVPDAALPSVPLVPTWLGDDGALLRAARTLDPPGLVVEALGAGHVPVPLIDQLSDAATTIPVILCTRVHSGQTFRHTYGFPGSELDLLGRGLIWGANLASPKARIYLVFALAAGWSASRIAEGVEARGVAARGVTTW